MKAEGTAIKSIFGSAVGKCGSRFVVNGKDIDGKGCKIQGGGI